MDDNLVGADRPGAGGAAATDHDTNAVRVLIGDSQALFAQALAASLAGWSEVEVLDPCTRSGVHTAQAAVILRPDFVLADLWFDDVTGPTAARSILAKAPRTHVVVLGWFYTAAHIQQALNAGASGFLAKSLRVADVVEAIGRVCDGERVVAHGQLAADGEEQAPTADGDGEAFTPRELEVLRLVGAGLPVEDVAARLDVSRETARSHVTQILAKTDSRSQLQAVAVARRQGVLV